MTCKCPSPWCPEHAVCPHDGSKLIILDDDPAFCEVCKHDVLPKNACRTNM